jgi:hypothetical protein
MPFTANRILLTGNFNAAGSVDVVFPLFSPLGEKSWVPQWDPELLHPAGATWEQGLVFRTNEESGDAIWVVSRLERSDHQVEYYRVECSRYVARIEVRCRAFSAAETEVQTAYEFIGLSEEGNRQIASMTHDDYKKKMIRWQNWINEHLEGLRSKRM